MTLQDTNERKVSSETSARIEGDDVGMGTPEQPSWSQRLLARIKQGERYKACAYFLATIL